MLSCKYEYFHEKTNQMQIKMLFLFLKWGGVWGGGLPPYGACPSPGININLQLIMSRYDKYLPVL